MRTDELTTIQKASWCSAGNQLSQKQTSKEKHANQSLKNGCYSKTKYISSSDTAPRESDAEAWKLEDAYLHNEPHEFTKWFRSLLNIISLAYINLKNILAGFFDLWLSVDLGL